MPDAFFLAGWNQLMAVLLAAAVWLVCRTRMLSRRPAVCHGLWLLVLLKFVTPAIVSVPVLPAHWVEASARMVDFALVPNPVASSGAVCRYCSSAGVGSQVAATPGKANRRCCLSTAAGSASSVTETGRSPNAPLSAWPAGVWGLLGISLCVSCVLWGIAVQRHFRVQRLLRGRAGESERGAELLRQVARVFGVRAAVKLQVVDAPITPMLWAAPANPMIIVPRSLMDSLSDDGVRGILAHELGHFTRRDHWVNLLAFFVRTLFWWNPMVWFACRQLSASAEACCDAVALEQLPGSRRTYAETLLAVVDSLPIAGSRRSAFGIPFGESRSLKRRFEMIADGGVKARMTPCGWFSLAIGFALLMFIPARGEDESSRTAETVERQPAVQSAEPPSNKGPSEFPVAVGCPS